MSHSAHDIIIEAFRTLEQVTRDRTGRPNIALIDFGRDEYQIREGFDVTFLNTRQAALFVAERLTAALTAAVAERDTVATRYGELSAALYAKAVSAGQIRGI